MEREELIKFLTWLTHNHSIGRGSKFEDHDGVLHEYYEELDHIDIEDYVDDYLTKLESDKPTN